MKIIKVLSIIICAGLLLSLPQALINQDFLHEKADQLLQLKITPKFHGERAVSFRDEMGDSENADILALSIYKPQRVESWADTMYYWQISYRLESIDLETLRMQHYFNFADESHLGRTDTFDKRSELVTFSNEFPWQYVISILGENARISRYDQSWSETLEMHVDYDSATIYLRIPVEYSNLRRVYRSVYSYHYLLSGSYDPGRRGKFRSLNKRNLLKPNILDYLTPKGVDQNELLNSYDDDTFTYVMLEPVIYNDDVVEKDEVSDEMILEIIKKLKSNDNSSHDNRGVELFHLGQYNEAESVFQENLKINPESAVDIAYLGSIIAIKGGDSSSLSESMELVLLSYDYFAKALKYAKSDRERVDVYLNRINVSMVVPDSVFHKKEQAINDLLSVVDLLDEERDFPLVMDCYWKMITVYREKKMIDEYYIYRDHMVNLLNRSGIDLPL